MKNSGASVDVTRVDESTTITGAQFRDFCNNHWPGKDWYIDDVGFEFEDEEGNFILPDDALIRLGDCGYICWQGKEGTPHSHGEMFPFIDFWRRHHEADETEILVVRINASQGGEVRSWLRGIGAEIVGDPLTEPVARSRNPGTPSGPE